MRLLIIALFLMPLIACGDSAKSLDGAAVMQAFTSAGITTLTDIKDETEKTRSHESPLPKSFTENWTFTDTELKNGKGGQVFICAEKSHCDAIYAYYDMLKGIAGPYIYQSKSGLAVLQLNSEHTPDQANTFKKVIESL